MSVKAGFFRSELSPLMRNDLFEVPPMVESGAGVAFNEKSTAPLRHSTLARQVKRRTYLKRRATKCTSEQLEVTCLPATNESFRCFKSSRMSRLSEQSCMWEALIKPKPQ